MTCPIPVPMGYLVFHGRPNGNGITYEPGIPLGHVDCRRWVLTWDGVGQWVTPQFIPTVEHWVAIPGLMEEE